ncbi:MAG TPA: HEAT repeat domain-containing protein [Pirellulales bacterium]|jgi:HEAT repeat protein|nr:HEAT repeat domain-containing protein [Pirellulales bacterium]
MRSFCRLAALIGHFGGLGAFVVALGWSASGQTADAPTKSQAAKAPPAAATDNSVPPRSVDELVKAAMTGSVSSREDAIDDLTDLGPKAKAAVPQLTELLKAKEPGVRWRSARALGAIGPGAADATAALAAALDDPDHHVRSHAAYALGTIGPASQKYVKALVARITDEDPHVRRAAIRAIDRLHPDSDEVVPAVAAALSAADPSVALAAVQSLATYGEKALPTAIKVLSDAKPKSKARYWACVLLAEFGPKAETAVDPLTEALSDEDVGIRMQAALALGQIGPAAKNAVPALMLTLDDSLMGVRYTAAYALGLIGDKKAVPALKKTSVGKDTLLNTLSIWAIAKIEPDNAQAVDKAIDAIIAAMEDKRPEVRQTAAQALWDLKAPHEKVGPALAAALNDEDPEVVSNVLDSLASLGEKIAPRVSTALEDPKRRAKALALVQRMGPQAKDCLPALLKLLDQKSGAVSDDETTSQALMALGAIGPDAADAVAAISESLDSKDPQVVAAACYALGRIGRPAVSALPEITKQLNNESLYTRVSAAWALVSIDERDKQREAKLVLPLLLDALDNEVPLVQIEAAETLGALGPVANSALPKLQSLVDHNNGAVGAAARWAIGQIESK